MLRYLVMPESFFPPWMQGSSPDWPLGALAPIASFVWVVKIRILPGKTAFQEGFPGLSLRISTYSIASLGESGKAVAENLWAAIPNRTCPWY
jgi:hypothetical protein